MQTTKDTSENKIRWTRCWKRSGELPHARASIASVQRPIGSSSYILDAEVDLIIANKEVTLLIEVKRVVYPRDIRQILWQLARARNEYAPSRQHEVVPPCSRRFDLSWRPGTAPRREHRLL